MLLQNLRNIDSLPDEMMIIMEIQIKRVRAVSGSGVNIVTDFWLDKWDKQRKKEIENFTANWNWEHVFLAWRYRLKDYMVSLKPLFTEVWVYDSKYPVGRQNELSWWPEKRIKEFQVNFQRHLDNYPGTNGPIHPYEIRQGELNTLHYLWSHKENEEKIAAILINASLFSRLYSSRGQYPNNYWPPHHCVEELYKWAYEIWHGQNEFSAWQHYHTEVLPYMNRDFCYQLNSMDALIRYLADEHALVFLKFKPVTIEFKEKCEPFIQRILNKEYSAKRKLEEFKESQNTKITIQHKDMKPAPSKNYKWTNISKNELEKLVWSKPTTILAKELGVSDVAIAKRCKSLGITKPKPGFWAKVKAGLIPHPQGKPTNFSKNGGRR
jgi:hypothetical protein